MEKNIRLRIEHRLVGLPNTSQAPVLVGVNCWRLTIVYKSDVAPTIDGVRFDAIGPGTANFERLEYGGVYDADGKPVYINQVFAMRNGFPVGQGQVVLIEEYLDHNARQNR
jgi:hypothetical protein